MIVLWLLHHGAMVWKAGIALFVLAGFGLAHRRSKRAAGKPGASPLSYALSSAAGGLLGLALFSLLGSALLRLEDRHAAEQKEASLLPVAEPRDEGSGFEARRGSLRRLALAAMTPFAREEALDRATAWPPRYVMHDGRKTFATWAKLYEARRRCDDAMMLWLVLGQRDEATATARRCLASAGSSPAPGEASTCPAARPWLLLREWSEAAAATETCAEERRQKGLRGPPDISHSLATLGQWKLDEEAVLLWYSAGDFEAAARAATHLEGGHHLRAKALLLAGELARASEHVKVIAEARIPVEGAAPASTEALQRDWRCAADALAARAHDGAALARLQAAASSGGACAVLWIDLLEGEARLDAIRAARGSALGPTLAWWLDLLDVESDPGAASTRVSRDRWNELVNWPCHVLATSIPALERPLAERLALDPDPSDPVRMLRARVSATSAVLALAAGDYPAALRFARIHREDVRTLSAGGTPSDKPRRDAVARAGALEKVAERAVQNPAAAWEALWHRDATTAGAARGSRIDWVEWHDGTEEPGLVCLLRSETDGSAWSKDAGPARYVGRASGTGVATSRFTDVWQRDSRPAYQLDSIERLAMLAIPRVGYLDYQLSGYGERPWLGLQRLIEGPPEPGTGDAGLSNAERARPERFYRAFQRRDVALPLAFLDVGPVLHDDPSAARAAPPPPWMGDSSPRGPAPAGDPSSRPPCLTARELDDATQALTNAGPTAPPAAPLAPAGDSVGIPECDEYLKKRQDCFLRSKAYAAVAEGTTRGLRESWQRMATTPSGSSRLKGICQAWLASFRCRP